MKFDCVGIGARGRKVLRFSFEVLPLSVGRGLFETFVDF